MRDAAEVLRLQSFANQVAAELAKLHNDPAAWESYMSEADATDVADGLD